MKGLDEGRWYRSLACMDEMLKDIRIPWLFSAEII